MKGSMSVVITVVLVALAAGLYFFLGKSKLDERRAELHGKRQQQEAELQMIEGYKVEKEELKKLLPRWKEQFELFRAAIPVSMEDDVFLRNLGEQLRANGVTLMAVDVSPAGQWFQNINETEEANYRKENVKPEELRLVKVANFSLSLVGDFTSVLRAFENMKLYGRIYALDRIISPAGGAGGAVFVNEVRGRTPMQISGRIFYGLSESYLSQDTLDRFFGRAEALGAASAIFEAATVRADQLSANPTAIPMPPGAAAQTPPAPANDAAADGSTDTGSGEATSDAEADSDEADAASTASRHTKGSKQVAQSNSAKQKQAAGA
jgi:hypothetical protein